VLRKKRFLIGGIIVFLAIGCLVFMAFQGSVTYYYTVSELMEQGSSIYDQNVRVKGQITPDSVERETGLEPATTCLEGMTPILPFL